MSAQENGQQYSVFLKVEEYWGNPEVIVITAEDENEAEEMYKGLVDRHENYIRTLYGIQKLDTFIKAIFVLRPPGDRNIR